MSYLQEQTDLLFQAIRENNEIKALKALSDGANPNGTRTVTEERWMKNEATGEFSMQNVDCTYVAIIEATKHKMYGLITELAKAGADFNVVEPMAEGKSALSVAADYADLQLVNTLISFGASNATRTYFDFKSDVHYRGQATPGQVALIFGESLSKSARIYLGSGESKAYTENNNKALAFTAIANLLGEIAIDPVLIVSPTVTRAICGAGESICASKL